MSKPLESSSFPADEIPVLETGSPLLLAPAKAAGKAKRQRIVLISSAVAGALVLLVVGWLLLRSRKRAEINYPALEREPDPAVTPPAARELVRPAASDLPPSPSLEQRLDALVKAAGQISDNDDQFQGNSRADRWDIRFPSGLTVDTYARRLDALGIELGVVGGGDTIVYASNFTKPKPDRREGPASQEHRVYMTWRSGPLRDLDATLLSRADVQSTDRIIAQFYPPALENQLATMEKQFADKHDLAEVRRTVFTLKETAAGQSFVVAEQEYMSGEIKLADQKPSKPKKEPKPPAEPPPEKKPE